MRVLIFLIVMVMPLFGLATIEGRQRDGSPDEDPAAIPFAEAEKHLIERPAGASQSPSLARTARITGVVYLTLEVDALGAVVGVPRSKGHPLLKAAAVEVARKYRYQPFVVNGAPAPVLVNARVSFVLTADPEPPFTPFPEPAKGEAIVIEYKLSCMTIRVSSQGLVEFESSCNWVVRPGKHSRRIETHEADKIVEAFRKANFFSLRESYRGGPGQEILSIQVGSASKSVTSEGAFLPVGTRSALDTLLRYSHSEQWTRGNAETVSGLLEEYPDPARRKRELSNLLTRAAFFFDTWLVRDLLTHPLDVDRRDSLDATALMLAAGRGKEDMVAALIDAGANIHARNRDGFSPLILAILSGNDKVVEILLKAGAGVNKESKDRDTRLHVAIASGNARSLRLLLDAGARVDEKDLQPPLICLASGAKNTGDDWYRKSPVWISRAEADSRAMISVLLDAGADIHANCGGKRTALFTWNEIAARELLQRGINLEARDDLGRTALINTTREDVAKLLIQAGADVNAQDKKGQTTLIRAVSTNNTSLLGVLASAPGVRFDLRDEKRMTALEIARATRNKECERILLAAGATR